MYINSENELLIISVSFCVEGTTAVGGVVSLRPPQIRYSYTVIPFCEGCMTICSLKADNVTGGFFRGKHYLSRVRESSYCHRTRATIVLLY